MKKIVLLLICIQLGSCQSNAQKKETKPDFEVSKTETEWRKALTAEEFNVLRKSGTEPAFSSPLNKIKKPGTFVCAACKNPLYQTKHKFDSGTGWPSFDRAIDSSLAISSDRKLGYKRTEALCGKCGSHLGHIFNDGPRETTGMRHCINGVALDFIPKNK
ncbi:peptide-methionine (R)-S-oxide reductase MsrB [Psychroflexus sp. ALD_RP9]|uniref:peptide-methionine (R)-S-oxide reductase MsrB n=1 Tax=Psychroflexus sp. ALD_RP9 TaxID=2777186 RepID=UPI001A8C8848|nr:peptide-methionine (R)-S-oxide reductase MsrB [Psychroflexus sp. ALD_RP9]QSS97485.1 peptide-methionine (R)-S-oxide reductase MsrB [Psychroflexus sp. ALD_RP9]